MNHRLTIHINDVDQDASASLVGCSLINVPDQAGRMLGLSMTDFQSDGLHLDPMLAKSIGSRWANRLTEVDGIHAAFQAAFQAAQERWMVRFRILGPQSERIPFETLYFESVSEHLAIRTNTAVCRIQQRDGLGAIQTVSERLHVLMFLAASGHNMDRLLKQFFRGLSASGNPPVARVTVITSDLQKINEVVVPDGIELKTKGFASVQDLLDAWQESTPSIVLICGHGSDEGEVAIQLTTASGRTIRVNDRFFSRIDQESQQRCSQIFLASCSGASTPNSANESNPSNGSLARQLLERDFSSAIGFSGVINQRSLEALVHVYGHQVSSVQLSLTKQWQTSEFAKSLDDWSFAVSEMRLRLFEIDEDRPTWLLPVHWRKEDELGYRQPSDQPSSEQQEKMAFLLELKRTWNEMNTNNSEFATSDAGISLAQLIVESQRTLSL